MRGHRSSGLQTNQRTTGRWIHLKNSADRAVITMLKPIQLKNDITSILITLISLLTCQQSPLNLLTLALIIATGCANQHLQ